MGKIKGSFARTYNRFVKRPGLLPDGLLALVRSISPESIVEFACGTGTVAVGLALEGYSVTGIDYSPEMLKAARRKAIEQNVKVEFKSADILEVDLNRQFDLLLCLGNTVPHFLTTTTLRQLIRNCQQHLNPEGTLIFQQLNYDRILKNRPRTFAVDIDQEIVRFKQYRYGKNLIDFVVTIADGAGIPPKIATSIVKLKPWTAAQLCQAIKKEGFIRIQMLSNYKGDAFSDESKDLILKGTAPA
jgi:2-polyprenyl-3-methyl-5-hydroxy-6-metoxy-1,4-benzoquinol methylase